MHKVRDVAEQIQSDSKRPVMSRIRSTPSLAKRPQSQMHISMSSSRLQEAHSIFRDALYEDDVAAEKLANSSANESAAKKMYQAQMMSNSGSQPELYSFRGRETPLQQRIVSTVDSRPDLLSFPNAAAPSSASRQAQSPQNRAISPDWRQLGTPHKPVRATSPQLQQSPLSQGSSL